MTDNIQTLDHHLQSLVAQAQQQADSVPTSVGMFSIRTANQTIREAAQRPDPQPLWLTLWYQGEVCCLFADSNVGKSIYAVQIANHIAQNHKVLYFDFELSDKQFQLRYTSPQGNLYQFPDSLYRVEINRDAYQTDNFDEAIITNIEAAATQTNAKILIIDNLTYLCITSEKGDAAGLLMMRLMALKHKYDLSILILAHTPKRAMSNVITQNDLAGSKKLFNFFDSVFAIGKSAKDPNLRYIKQIKVRHGSFTYDTDNVIVSSIEKESNFVHFAQIGFDSEREHIREPNTNDKSELIATVKQLSHEGKTQRQIAQELNISLGAVNKYIKKQLT